LNHVDARDQHQQGDRRQHGQHRRTRLVVSASSSGSTVDTCGIDAPRRPRESAHGVERDLLQIGFAASAGDMPAPQARRHAQVVSPLASLE
jgi:hypothetical protein